MSDFTLTAPQAELPKRPSWYALYDRIFVPADRVDECLRMTWPDLVWLGQCEDWTLAGSLSLACPDGYVALRCGQQVERA